MRLRTWMALAVLVMGLSTWGDATAEQQKSLDWTRRPSGRDVADVYPRSAADGGISGATVMSCRITGKGPIDACRILAEAPEGMGFGKAALRLAREFRLTPGGEGDRITLPIVFNLSNGSVPELYYQVGDMAKAADGAPVTWRQRPTLAETAPVLKVAEQTAGNSALDCLVGPGGALADCKASGEVSDKTQAAMLQLAGGLRASEPLVGKRVTLPFNWSALTRAAIAATD